MGLFLKIVGNIMEYYDTPFLVPVLSWKTVINHGFYGCPMFNQTHIVKTWYQVEKEKIIPVFSANLNILSPWDTQWVPLK